MPCKLDYKQKQKGKDADVDAVAVVSTSSPDLRLQAIWCESGTVKLVALQHRDAFLSAVPHQANKIRMNEFRKTKVRGVLTFVPTILVCCLQLQHLQRFTLAYLCPVVSLCLLLHLCPSTHTKLRHWASAKCARCYRCWKRSPIRNRLGRNAPT